MARVTKTTLRKVARAERAASKVVTKAKTTDSFQNFALQLGMGTANALSASTYGFNPITRMRTLLEWMYRGSWLAGMAVDVVADDMTRAGIEIQTDMKPVDVDKLQKFLVTSGSWEQISDFVKWARLYGGSVCVFLVDGQDVSTPLNLESVVKGRFRGLITLDRWMCEPDLQRLVTDYGPDLGMPEFYRVTADAPALRGKTIHYTRLMRMDGIKLPYWQKISENFWGISVIERMYDRMVGYDSATQGASQLVYKSFLRTIKMDGLREAITTGGFAEAGIIKMVEFMRLTQSNEGITLIDGKDDFTVSSNSGFSGIADVILQLAQQVSGSLQIPLTRLLGQSPAGLNSTGESDLRTYYDGIAQQQNKVLRVPMGKIIRMIAQSEGMKLEEEFSFTFRPLWQLTEEQKSQVADRDTATTLAVESAGLISPKTALKELKQQSRVTGRWTNITDEDIEDADDEIAPSPEELGMGGFGEEGEEGAGGGEFGEKKIKGAPKPPKGGKSSLEPKGPKDASDKKLKLVRDEAAQSILQYVSSFAGLPLIIETRKGAVRSGQTKDGTPWSVQMPCDYGYLEHTHSAEDTPEQREELDCFVGPHADSRHVFVVDTCDPVSKAFDEHKVMLGFQDSREALRTFAQAYEDGSGTPTADRIMATTHSSLDSFELREWLKGREKSLPFYQLISGRAA